jgi:hypothetical protein
MRTDELIRVLAADSATRAAPVRRWMLVGIVVALLVSLAMFSLLLGPRSDIRQVAADFDFLFKFVFTLAVALPATLLVLRLAQPAVPWKPTALSLLVAPALLGLAVTAEFFLSESGSRVTKVLGTTWLSCVTFIPLLSAPVLVAALVALHHGAPTRPGIAGAVAGLAAGGFGAAIYAAYCIENSALFLAAWYPLAILIVAIAGGALGARVLRW